MLKIVNMTLMFSNNLFLFQNAPEIFKVSDYVLFDLN